MTMNRAMLAASIIADLYGKPPSDKVIRRILKLLNDRITTPNQPQDNDLGSAFIIHNEDDTVTIKVRSPGDQVFSEIEMPLDVWIKLRSVGGPDFGCVKHTWNFSKSFENPFCAVCKITLFEAKSERPPIPSDDRGD